jgi:hypothetical protein
MIYKTIVYVNIINNYAVIYIFMSMDKKLSVHKHVRLLDYSN